MTTSATAEWRRHAVRHLLLLFSTALASSMAEPAAAQTVGDGSGSPPSSTPSTHYTPPADRLLVSPGGVDLRTGRYAFNETDLSIGGAEQAGRLSFARILSTNVPGHANPFGNMTHNWDIVLVQKRIDLGAHNFHPNASSDYWASVKMGGTSDTFTKYVNGTAYQDASTAQLTKLTFTGSTQSSPDVYTYVKTDGTTIVFHSINGSECSSYYQCAYAASMTLATGEAFTFSYENFAPGVADGTHLKSVVSSTGYGLVLDYGGDPHAVSAACVVNLATQSLPSNCANITNSAAYAYDYANGTRLASATGPAGRETYGYNGSAMSMTRGNDTLPWLVNTTGTSLGEDQAVTPITTSQAFSDGRTYTYDYQDNPYRRDDEPMQNYGMGYTDGQGRHTTTQYDFQVDPVSGNSFNNGPGPYSPINVGSLTYVPTPAPATVIDPNGNQTTFDYCDRNAEQQSNQQYRCYMSELQSYTLPDGERVELTYDFLAAHTISRVRRLSKPGSSIPEINTYATHHCIKLGPACTQPTSTTDANGNVTTFAYDPIHGGIRREADPAGDNGIQAVKRYAYVQRHAWVSDGNGGYVGSGPLIWLLSTMKTCRSTATTTDEDINAQSCVGGAADEVVTAYDYGPDNGPNTLLLRGFSVTADGETHRTCYRYDDQGNRTATTAPRAGLTSCP